MRGREVLVRHRAGAAGRFGAEGAAEPDVEIGGVIIVPISSAEQADREEVVVDGLTAYCPPGSDVLATDEVTARGKRYRVVGDPLDYRTAKGRRKVLAVTLSRKT